MVGPRCARRRWVSTSGEGAGGRKGPGHLGQTALELSDSLASRGETTQPGSSSGSESLEVRELSLTSSVRRESAASPPSANVPSAAARRRHGPPEGPSPSLISVMLTDNLSARQFLRLTRERERGGKLHRQWQRTPEPTSRPESETNRDVWPLEQVSSRSVNPLTSSPLFLTNRSNCYLVVRGKGPAEALFSSLIKGATPQAETPVVASQLLYHKTTAAVQFP